jgi:hypothetical protein
MIIQSTVIDRLQYLLKVPQQSHLLDVAEVCSRARENLADTVTPYRWSAEQLAEFVSDGAAELKTMRSDVALLDNIPDAFSSALANYTVYRALALDNDAQNNNGALSDKYLNLFISQANSVPFFFTAEQLEKFADETVTDLIAKRPELRLSAGETLKENIKVTDGWDLPERFADAVIFGAAGRAALHSRNDTANYFFEQYNGALRTI